MRTNGSQAEPVLMRTSGSQTEPVLMRTNGSQAEPVLMRTNGSWENQVLVLPEPPVLMRTGRFKNRNRTRTTTLNFTDPEIFIKVQKYQGILGFENF